MVPHPLRWANRTRRRSWFVILGLSVLAVPLSFVAATLALMALVLAIVAYGIYLTLLGVWNGWVVVDLLRGTWAVRRHPRLLALRLPLTALAGASLALWGIPYDIFNRPKAPMVLAALFALLYAVGQFLLTARRSRRDYFAPVYNLFNLFFLGAFAAAEGGGGDPGPLGYFFAKAVTLFQMLNISFLAGFGPMFVLPSFLPKLKGLRLGPGAEAGWDFHRLLRRLPARLAGGLGRAAWALSKASGGFVLYASVALIILFPLAAGSIGGFYGLDPSGLAYRPTQGVEFSATGGVFTDVVRAPTNWRDLVDQEVVLAHDLHLRYIRYDVKTEFLRDPASLAALDQGVETLRASGLGIILSPFGSDRWGNAHPTLAELQTTLDADALLLAQRYHPDYVFPYFEPNGQVQINLGYALATDQWVAMIDNVTQAIKATSPGTRVLIEVADGVQGPPLFEALLGTPGVDAVGFDIYPGGVGDLGKVDAYAALASQHPSRGFWLSEFGMDTIQNGEVVQAHFIAKLISEGSTRWNVTGYNVWSLEDNAGVGMDQSLKVGLGLVTLTGHRKAGFEAYRDAIAAVS